LVFHSTVSITNLVHGLCPIDFWTS